MWVEKQRVQQRQKYNGDIVLVVLVGLENKVQEHEGKYIENVGSSFTLLALRKIVKLGIDPKLVRRRVYQSIPEILVDF